MASWEVNNKLLFIYRSRILGELFRKFPSLGESWIIKEIKVDLQERRVNIFINFPRRSRFSCLLCGKQYSVHDTENRTWRYLLYCFLSMAVEYLPPVFIFSFILGFRTILFQVQFPVILDHLRVRMPQVAVLPEVVHVDLQYLLRLLPQG